MVRAPIVQRATTDCSNKRHPWAQCLSINHLKGHANPLPSSLNSFNGKRNHDQSPRNEKKRSASGALCDLRFLVQPFRRTLTASEQAAYIKALTDQGISEEQKARLAAFMASDDGNDFVIVNLIHLNPSPETLPATGPGAPARSSTTTWSTCSSRNY